MWNALLGKEWVNVYIQWKCVETLYIFTSILLSHPEHSSAKKLCINILQYNSWLGNWQTALCMRYTVSLFTFSKISMAKHLQVYATSRKVVFSFKRALFLQNIPVLGDNLWCFHLSQYSSAQKNELKGIQPHTNMKVWGIKYD